MIKALLLDLDGTLLDDEAAWLAGTKAFYEAHADYLKQESFEEFLQRGRDIARRHWSRYVAGELDFIGHQRERAREALGVKLSDAMADEAFDFHRAAYRQSCRCFDDVAAFLHGTKGLRKIAVTNAHRIPQRAKMESAGLLADIPDLVTPEDVGVWKPEPAIFHHALAKLDMEPHEALMVGDDYACDIVGAERVGMKAFWVRRGINDLSGALALLNE